MAILFHCPWDNSDQWLAALQAALPNDEFRIWPDVGDPDEIDFAMVWKLPHGVLAKLPNLTGVSSLGAGVDALIEDPDYELSELAEGLENRGVQSDLALEVATQMTDHDALGAHAREELGMFGLAGQADPLQAAGASALAFALGGGLPLFAAVLAPAGLRGVTIALVALLALILLGAGGAQLGGAPKRPAIGRVVVWGGLAMAVTAGVGHLFGAIG